MLRFLLSFLMTVPLVTGQLVDATRAGDAVPLSADWRFHEGDDPHWADASFDDSGWQLVSPLQPWKEQGLAGYIGLLWSIKVRLPNDGAGYSLLLSNAVHSYKVYADGVRLGQWGNASACSGLRKSAKNGERITFIFDGVVEARNVRGELYGFDHTRAASTQPAASLAQTAKDFGQDDGIMVFAVERAG